MKAGIFADFIVLQRDPLTMKKAYMHMRDIKILETRVRGALIYSSEAVNESVSMA